MTPADTYGGLTRIMAEKLPLLHRASSISASVDRRVLYGGWEQPWTTAVDDFRSVNDSIRGGSSTSSVAANRIGAAQLWPLTFV